MIRSIRGNRSTFHAVEFPHHFNVLVADTTDETSADRFRTRNSSGKTTLLHILHYCLGADPRKPLFAGEAGADPALAGWAFTLELEVAGHDLIVTRAVDDGSEIQVGGDVGILPIELVPPQPDLFGDRHAGHTIGDTALRRALGHLMFGLPPQEPREAWPDVKGGPVPSFRQLVSYFARTDPAGYTDPLRFMQQVRGGREQVLTAFLVGLDWQDTAEVRGLLRVYLNRLPGS